MTQLHVSAALLGSEYRNSGPVTISIENGHIAEIVPAATPNGPARLAMPSLADAALIYYVFRLWRQTFGTMVAATGCHAPGRCLYRRGGFVGAVRPGRRDWRNGPSNPRDGAKAFARRGK